MTRRQELSLAAVGALLVLVAATLLLVRPTRQATAEARADREAAVTESQMLRDQIKALEALKPNEAELKAKASLVRAECPASPALPGLVDAPAGFGQPGRGRAGDGRPDHPQDLDAQPAAGRDHHHRQRQRRLLRDPRLPGPAGEPGQGIRPGSRRPTVGADPVDQPGRRGRHGDRRLGGGHRRGLPSPDELKGNIVLTVFQMAQPSGSSSSPAAPAATASQGAQVR